MLPNLMRSVIAQVPRGGRSVVSRRGFSSPSGEASAGSGDPDFLFLRAASWGFFASVGLACYQLAAAKMEQFQAAASMRKSQAEQEDD